MQKYIANNVLDLKRNQASNVLKQARIAVNNNNQGAAKESLTDATNRHKKLSNFTQRTPNRKRWLRRQVSSFN